MTVSRSEFFRPQQLLSCRLATREGTLFNLNGSYFNGTNNNGVGATLTNATTLAALQIDSTSVENGDRVLLISQTQTLQNGIYQVIEKGSSAVAWVLQRTNDFQSAEQIKAGFYVTVEDGLFNSGSVYTVVRPVTGNVGFDPIHFRSADQDSIEQSNVLARTISTPGLAATVTLSVTGIKASSVVVANFESTTNPVFIHTVAPGIDEIVIVCDAAPGASFVNFIAFIDSI